MKIVCEFGDKKEHDMYCEDVAGVKSLKLDVQTLRGKVQELEDNARKAILTTGVASETYSVDNIKAVCDMIVDKVIKYQIDNGKTGCLYQLVYSGVLHRIKKEYDGLGEEVRKSLFREAWKYGVARNVFFKEKRKELKFVVLKESVLGGVAVKRGSIENK